MSFTVWILYGNELHGTHFTEHISQNTLWNTSWSTFHGTYFMEHFMEHILQNTFCGTLCRTHFVEHISQNTFCRTLCGTHFVEHFRQAICIPAYHWLANQHWLEHFIGHLLNYWIFILYWKLLYWNIHHDRQVCLFILTIELYYCCL